jgi:hypothetical protein
LSWSGTIEPYGAAGGFRYCFGNNNGINIYKESLFKTRLVLEQALGKRREKMPLPITPNKILQGEYNSLRQSNSEIRQGIFAIFRHWSDDRSGILLRSNFEAKRHQYLSSFTAERIQTELENMEKDEYLQIVGDDFHLTPKGKEVVYNI